VNLQGCVLECRWEEVGSLDIGIETENSPRRCRIGGI